jgi:hypothetical protein
MYLFNGYSPAEKTVRYAMRLGVEFDDRAYDMGVTGSRAMQLINWEEAAKDDALLGTSNGETIKRETEALAFLGNLRVTPFDNRDEALNIGEYSPSLVRHSENPLFPVANVHPVEHNDFRLIIDDRNARETAVRLLKEFEPDIMDLRYINEMQRAVPVVETKHKNIPLSVYGDGMKRALLALNAIISAQTGVVLADEFEMAIHTSAMGKVFEFILNSAQEMDVQLFLTTHSIEAVDKLLESAGDGLDRIRLIRLKNKAGKIYAKIVSGAEARGLREQFEMELRV